MDETLRILAIVEGDPYAPLTLSGVPGFLVDALARRFSVVGRVDYGLRGLRRITTAALTFQPERARWVARFHLTPRAHRALSNTLAERLRSVDQRCDVVFQVHGYVGGQPHPYVLYVDQTRVQVEAAWPNWLPMSGSARADGRRLEAAMYRGAYHIFVMGRPARESLIADYGLDPERITIAGGGVNFRTLPEARVTPTPDPSILFVGREFERKGGEVLLAAFRAVREHVPAAALHIVGPTRRFSEPGVISHGKLSSREQLGDLYRDARVVCAPSLYEPWGLVFMEAMAYGIPCVGTSVQSIPDILDQGRAGLLVPPGDVRCLAEGIIRLLRDDDLAQALGAEGRRRVERQFTWERVVEAMAPALLSARGASRETRGQHARLP